jgi:hypothetical protein
LNDEFGSENRGFTMWFPGKHPYAGAVWQTIQAEFEALGGDAGQVFTLPNQSSEST